MKKKLFLISFNAQTQFAVKNSMLAAIKMLFNFEIVESTKFAANCYLIDN